MTFGVLFPERLLPGILRIGVGQVYISNQDVSSCVALEAAVPPLALVQYDLGCQLEVAARLAEQLGLLGLKGDLRSIEDI